MTATRAPTANWPTSRTAGGQVEAVVGDAEAERGGQRQTTPKAARRTAPTTIPAKTATPPR